MANQVCRSSGVLGSSAIVNREQSLLISIHANLIVVSNALVTVKVFDGTSASGTEIARITHSVRGIITLNMICMEYCVEAVSF